MAPSPRINIRARSDALTGMSTEGHHFEPKRSGDQLCAVVGICCTHQDGPAAKCWIDTEHIRRNVVLLPIGNAVALQGIMQLRIGPALVNIAPQFARRLRDTSEELQAIAH
jgi:hypothetical protein